MDSKRKDNFKDGKRKKLKKDDNKNGVENSQSDSQNDDLDDSILSDEIVYNMPKPGPHAKVVFFLIIFELLNIKF